MKLLKIFVTAFALSLLFAACGEKPAEKTPVAGEITHIALSDTGILVKGLPAEEAPESTVYVAKDREEKALQRALLQYYNPKNRQRVMQALKMTHREDLVPVLLGTTPRTKTEMTAKGHAPVRKKKPVADWKEIQKRNKRIGKNKQ